ncbi:MAG: YceD family protein [Pseudanabaenales cyanobacterium]|nr:YceD family protein [Pseudanabaenales cyanobacterium]
MEALYIPQLVKVVDKTQVISFRERLPGLETLTPVQGELIIKHQGNYLEVKAQAETIMTLTCNRCLQNYNHRLSVDTSELIWLEDPSDRLEGAPLEREVGLEDLVESLSPQGYFHPSEWLYEQLCLAIPQQQICQLECPGIQLVEEPKANFPVDHRWSTLAAFKTQLPDS